MIVSFFDRIGAYFIDLIIISLLIGIVGMGLPSDTEMADKISELEAKLISGEVNSEEVLTEYEDLFYDYQKDMVLTSSVGVAIYIAYFVIFQYMYNGQTFGKKLLKIKVVNSSDGRANLFQMFLRYLFIMNIFSGIANIILLFILPKNSYLSVYLLIVSIESIFIIVSLLLVLYRKDKRGLHDLMANTKVVKEV